MKNLLLSLTLVIASFAGVIAQPQVVTGAAITLDKDVNDYGDVAFGGNGECEFKVTNSGTEPLIMSGCQGSCGCTVPKCDTNPIMPGETSIINVKYDTKRPGPFTKTVTINSNAVNEPTKIVTIKGTVAADPGSAPSGVPEKTQGGAPNK